MSKKTERSRQPGSSVYVLLNHNQAEHDVKTAISLTQIDDANCIFSKISAIFINNLQTFYIPELRIWKR